MCSVSSESSDEDGDGSNQKSANPKEMKSFRDMNFKN